MDDFIQILSIVSGTVSLAGVIYLLGHWKGQIDAKTKILDQYSISDLALMIKTLWDVYVMDVLHQRPDLIQHNSPYHVTAKGEELIPPEIRRKLTCAINSEGEELLPPEIRRKVTCAINEGCPRAWHVIKQVGLPTIEKIAEEKGLTVQQTIAILAIYGNTDLV